MVFIVSSSIFTIVPVTQYVYLDHIVTFECATNMTEILYFDVGRALPFSVIPSSLPNGGTKISLSLTATNKSNGTDITCHIFNGTATEAAYIYVQGLYMLSLPFVVNNCYFQVLQLVLVIFKDIS